MADKGKGLLSVPTRARTPSLRLSVSQLFLFALLALGSLCSYPTFSYSQSGGLYPSKNTYGNGAGGPSRPSYSPSYWTQSNGPYGGSVYSIITNRDGYLFAGTWGAGIYLSTDSGDHWAPVNSGLTNNFVRSLVVDSSGNIFAGTWGGGIYVSDNEGNNWTQTNNGLSSLYICSLAVTSSGFIYAGTNGGGTYVSQNHGISWSPIVNGLTDHYVNSIHIGPASEVFACTNQGVFLSTDNGAMWSRLGLPPYQALSIAADSSGDLLVGTSIGVYRSIDNGANWSSTGLSSTVHSFFTDVSHHIFAAASDGVYLSNDNGGSWAKTGTIPVGAAQVVTNGPLAGIWVGTIGGGVYYSLDHGSMWTAADAGILNNGVSRLAVSPSGQIFAATTGNVVYLSTDNGNTWSRRSVRFTSGNITSLVVNKSGALLCGTDGFGIYVSTDEAATWTQTTAGLFSTAVYALSVDSSGDIFAGTGGGSGVEISTDGGLNWVARSKGLTTTGITKLTIGPTGTVFAGNPEGNIYVSTNGGELWNAGTPVKGAVTSLAQDSAGRVFVATAGNGIYLSSDTGASWIPINYGLSNDTVYSVTSTSLDYILAATQEGTFVSTDLGNDWIQTSNGTEAGIVTTVASSPSGYLFGGTTFGGVLRSINSVTQLTPPILYVPRDDSSGTATSQTLEWHPALGASTYRLQVSLDSTFAIPLYDLSGLLTSSKTISGLLNSTKYYWRVEAVSSAGNSAWSPSWSFSTASGEPTLVSPSNGSTRLSATPTLSWNPLTGATGYELQVFTDTTAAGIPMGIVFDRSGIAGTLQKATLLEGQAYMWRVKASVPTGTTAWSATWDFTTGTAIIPLASPANGSAGVSLTPTISWTTDSGALSYDLRISTDPNFQSSSAGYSSLHTNSYTLPTLLSNTTYYWKVQAYTSSSGNTTGWSLAWSFTTMSATSVPQSPSPFSPGNASSGVSVSPNTYFDWVGSTGASWYGFQVATDVGFSNIVVNQTSLTEEQAIVTGLSRGVKYYWRICAGNSVGTSPWSSIWSFTTVAAIPQIPALASPANGVTGVSVSPTVSWNASTGAISYNLQVSADMNFGSGIISKSNISGTSYTLSGLSNNTTYYWRVNSTDSGGTSSWSTPWSFTTVSPSITIPPTPELATPNDESTGIDISPILTWGNSSGAAHYRLQMSTDSTFATIQLDTSNIAGTSFTLKDLAYSTKYFWRVDASNSAGSSDWSAPYSFKTIPAPLSVPILVSPPNASTSLGTSVRLGWNSSFGATDYDVQLSPYQGFDSIAADYSGIADTSFRVNGLATGKTFFWRVKASNSGTISGWSPVWSFTTFTYPSSINVSTQFTPPGTTDQTSYRIIGLPGAVDIPVAGLLSGKEGTDWNVYYDNGADKDYQVKDDGSSVFHFTPGRAFWILSSSGFSVSQNVSSVELDSSDNYSIPLHNGWNLISDPFQKGLPWSAVKSLNSVSQPIYGFNGSYNEPASLEPYVGYYFYNDQNLTSLKIPYVYTSVAQSKNQPQLREVTSAQDRIIELSLSSAKIRCLPVIIGFKSSASDTLSRVDLFAPPDNFDNLRIQVVDQGAKGTWKKLYSDFRSEIGQGQKFDIQVKNLTGVSTVIKPLVGGGLEDYRVFLTDNGTHTFYDLQTTDSISISGTYQYKDYSVLVGSQNYIDSAEAAAVPKGFGLAQNYPNPFNPVTIIRYEIPKEAVVSLRVYSALGQLVQTLVGRLQKPGYYEVPFDGHGLASGIYFCRIEAGAYNHVIKMLLLK